MVEASLAQSRVMPLLPPKALASSPTLTYISGTDIGARWLA